MSEITHVYLITGFLGSGKTTLLNRIIKVFPPDKKLTLLVNEFGEIGVDGALVEGEDIDMMEISKGSIFCVCVKTDFIKGLNELNVKFRPDVLLIESTGVANPSDLKKDLELPIFNNRFQFKEQFCVVDAAHFLEAYDIYASLEKQIASSSVFIINKTDLASAQAIVETKKVISKFHPNPIFIETTYADIPIERFFEMESAAEPQDIAVRDRAEPLSEEELEQFIDEFLDSPDLEITPPDLLMSIAYQWTGQNLEDVRSMAQHLPPSLVRAKGLLVNKNQVLLFSYTMGDWSLKETVLPVDSVEHENIVVFIAPPQGIEELSKIVTGDHWINRGTYQPFQGTERKHHA